MNVENRNYNEPGHIYSVRVADGHAVGCSCPHAVHRNAHCKHQVAVEDRPLVVSSAAAAGAAYIPPVATDGGQPAEKSAGGVDTPENGNESGSGVGESARGTVEVGGCAACDGYTTGGDEFCSDECRERGAVDDTPL